MQRIKVRASTVKKAMERAKKQFNDWQAQCLEIMMIPKVQRRWKQINPQFPDPTITRHEGEPHKFFTREMNLAVEDWSQIAGYVFGYGREGYMWNRVRSDWYGHSPDTAWDGVRRETYHSFVEALRMLTLKAMGEFDAIATHLEPALEQAKVEFVDDLEPDLFALYKFAEWDGRVAWFLRAVNLSKTRALRQAGHQQMAWSVGRVAVLPWSKKPGYTAPQEIAPDELPYTATVYEPGEAVKPKKESRRD